MIAKKHHINAATGFASFWQSFWYPNRYAAQQEESTLNTQIITANTAQDKLEAEMTAYLSRIEAEQKASREQTIKTASLLIAGVVIIFIVIKYV